MLKLIILIFTDSRRDGWFNFDLSVMVFLSIKYLTWNYCGIIIHFYTKFNSFVISFRWYLEPIKVFTLVLHTEALTQDVPCAFRPKYLEIKFLLLLKFESFCLVRPVNFTCLFVYAQDPVNSLVYPATVWYGWRSLCVYYIEKHRICHRKYQVSLKLHCRGHMSNISDHIETK